MYQAAKMDGAIYETRKQWPAETEGGKRKYKPFPSHGAWNSRRCIYFDDLKGKNTSLPHINVCPPCVGGGDYLTVVAHSSVVTCLNIPSWLCVFVYMAVQGQHRTWIANYCSTHICCLVVGWSLLNVLLLVSQFSGLCRKIRLPEITCLFW